MNDYNIYFTYSSVGYLIASGFGFYLAIFLLTIKDKSSSTTWFGISMLFVSIFYGTYVPVYTIYFPQMAFHRWFTVVLIFLPIAFMLQMFLRIGRLESQRVANFLLFILVLPSLIFGTWFIYKSLNANYIFKFDGHFWDFDLPVLSLKIGLGIVVSLITSYVFIIWKIFKLKGRDRITLIFYYMGFIIIGLIPGILNTLTYDGGVSREIWQVLMNIMMLIGLFVFLLTLLNSGTEKSTFMAKIVSTSLVTFLLVLSFVAYFTLSDQEDAYDKQMRQKTAHILSNEFYRPAELEYIKQFSPNQKEINLYLKSDKIPVIVEPVHHNADAVYQFEIWRNDLNDPDSTKPAIIAQDIPQSEMSTNGYMFQAAYCKLYLDLMQSKHIPLNSEEIKNPSAHSNTENFEDLESLNRRIFYNFNKMRKLPANGYRKNLRNYLESQKHKWLDFLRLPDSFRETLSVQLEKSPNEDAKLKQEFAGQFILMQPPGTRLYRRDIGTASAQQHFIAYMQYDRNSNTIYEAGFDYLHYRRYIHGPSLKLFVIILIVILVIVIAYPLFFRGSLIQPLGRLLDGMQQVNRGDLDIKIKAQVNDEIGFLSNSFTGMVGSIRGARDNLEQTVADRTEELNQANLSIQKTYEKLKAMDELKTNFFANISHELRTPLTLILSPMESLLQNEAGRLEPGQRELIISMHKNGQKLLKLINNLLDFSKLEAGKMQLSYKEVNFTNFVSELASAFDSAASSLNLELKVQSSDPLIKAFIDTEKMEKVVLNLLSNAFKFTKKGGIYLEINKISITKKAENRTGNQNDQNGDPQTKDGTIDFIELLVRDTGVGIPQNQLETIFERFSQVDGSASRQYEGTGIGLSLARELAQLHDG